MRPLNKVSERSRVFDIRLNSTLEDTVLDRWKYPTGIELQLVPEGDEPLIAGGRQIRRIFVPAELLSYRTLSGTLRELSSWAAVTDRLVRSLTQRFLPTTTEAQARAWKRRDLRFALEDLLVLWHGETRENLERAALRPRLPQSGVLVGTAAVSQHAFEDPSRTQVLRPWEIGIPRNLLRHFREEIPIVVTRFPSFHALVLQPRRMEREAGCVYLGMDNLEPVDPPRLPSELEPALERWNPQFQRMERDHRRIVSSTFRDLARAPYATDVAKALGGDLDGDAYVLLQPDERDTRAVAEAWFAHLAFWRQVRVGVSPGRALDWQARYQAIRSAPESTPEQRVEALAGRAEGKLRIGPLTTRYYEHAALILGSLRQSGEPWKLLRELSVASAKWFEALESAFDLKHGGTSAGADLVEALSCGGDPPFEVFAPVLQAAGLDVEFFKALALQTGQRLRRAAAAKNLAYCAVYQAPTQPWLAWYLQDHGDALLRRPGALLFQAEALPSAWRSQ